MSHRRNMRNLGEAVRGGYTCEADNEDWRRQNVKGSKMYWDKGDRWGQILGRRNVAADGQRNLSSRQPSIRIGPQNGIEWRINTDTRNKGNAGFLAGDVLRFESTIGPMHLLCITAPSTTYRLRQRCQFRSLPFWADESALEHDRFSSSFSDCTSYFARLCSG